MPTVNRCWKHLLCTTHPILPCLFTYSRLCNMRLEMKWHDWLLSCRHIVQNTFRLMDGTDCRTQKPTFFNSRLLSYRFQWPDVRCGIAVSNGDENTVWVTSSFSRDECPDMKICRSHLCNMLLPNEVIVSDNGYQFEIFVTFDTVSLDERPVGSILRARHKICNAQLKHYNILRNTFRHSIRRHNAASYAVAKLTALNSRFEKSLLAV